MVFLSEFHPFRQYRGSGARYLSDEGEVKVPAYVHHMSEFISGGLEHGLELVECGEWFSTGAEEQGKLPRLLTLLWRGSYAESDEKEFRCDGSRTVTL